MPEASGSGLADEADYSTFENKTGLADDMKFLARMPELCDVTFLVGETREPVCAVKAVLAARSRVFHRMLYQAPSPQRKKEPPPRENKIRLFLKRSSEPLLNLQNAAQQPNQHHTLIIEEFEPDVFRQLIEYIHTGCVTLQPRTLLGVMNAADYYGLDELKKACSGFVQCCITVDTVCALLASAERYIQYKCTKSLVQRVLEFVDDHGNEVLNLGSFTLLPQHVVRLILAREELRADEFAKFQAALMWSKKYYDSNQTTPLKDVIGNFLEYIQFHKIPTNVLMNEVHPLNLVPHEIIMNALAYQADPTSIDPGKLSPHRVRRPGCSMSVQSSVDQRGSTTTLSSSGSDAGSDQKQHSGKNSTAEQETASEQLLRRPSVQTHPEEEDVQRQIEQRYQLQQQRLEQERLERLQQEEEARKQQEKERQQQEQELMRQRERELMKHQEEEVKRQRDEESKQDAKLKKREKEESKREEESKKEQEKEPKKKERELKKQERKESKKELKAKKQQEKEESKRQQELKKKQEKEDAEKQESKKDQEKDELKKQEQKKKHEKEETKKDQEKDEPKKQEQKKKHEKEESKKQESKKDQEKDELKKQEQKKKHEKEEAKKEEPKKDQEKDEPRKQEQKKKQEKEEAKKQEPKKDQDELKKQEQKKKQEKEEAKKQEPKKEQEKGELKKQQEQRLKKQQEKEEFKKRQQEQKAKKQQGKQEPKKQREEEGTNQHQEESKSQQQKEQHEEQQDEEEAKQQETDEDSKKRRHIKSQEDTSSSQEVAAKSKHLEELDKQQLGESKKRQQKKKVKDQQGQELQKQEDLKSEQQQESSRQERELKEDKPEVKLQLRKDEEVQGTSHQQPHQESQRSRGLLGPHEREERGLSREERLLRLQLEDLKVHLTVQEQMMQKQEEAVLRQIRERQYEEQLESGQLELMQVYLEGRRPVPEESSEQEQVQMVDRRESKKKRRQEEAKLRGKEPESQKQEQQQQEQPQEQSVAPAGDVSGFYIRLVVRQEGRANLVWLLKTHMF